MPHRHVRSLQHVHLPVPCAGEVGADPPPGAYCVAQIRRVLPRIIFQNTPNNTPHLWVVVGLRMGLETTLFQAHIVIEEDEDRSPRMRPVSYTHLTLPTILLV